MAAGRAPSLDEMGGLHAAVHAAIRDLPESDWARKHP
jgi:hypothetical protein